MPVDEKIPVRCAGEDWCPIQATATILCKKWHPVIIHRLLEHGPMGFNDLKSEVDGISSKVLSDNLDELEGYGFVDRSVVSEKPFRVSYSLTPRGESTQQIIYDMREWGQEYLAEPVGDAPAAD